MGELIKQVIECLQKRNIVYREISPEYLAISVEGVSYTLVIDDYQGIYFSLERERGLIEDPHPCIRKILKDLTDIEKIMRLFQRELEHTRLKTLFQKEKYQWIVESFAVVSEDLITDENIPKVFNFLKMKFPDKTLDQLNVSLSQSEAFVEPQENGNLHHIIDGELNISFFIEEIISSKDSQMNQEEFKKEVC